MARICPKLRSQWSSFKIKELFSGFSFHVKVLDQGNAKPCDPKSFKIVLQVVLDPA